MTEIRKKHMLQQIEQLKREAYSEGYKKGYEVRLRDNKEDVVKLLRLCQREPIIDSEGESWPPASEFCEVGRIVVVDDFIANDVSSLLDHFGVIL